MFATIYKAEWSISAVFTLVLRFILRKIENRCTNLLICISFFFYIRLNLEKYFFMSGLFYIKLHVAAKSYYHSNHLRTDLIEDWLRLLSLLWIKAFSYVRKYFRIAETVTSLLKQFLNSCQPSNKLTTKIIDKKMLNFEILNNNEKHIIEN